MTLTRRNAHDQAELVLGVHLQLDGHPNRGWISVPFAGWVLSPIIVSAAMAFSSVSVVLNGLRLACSLPA